MKEKKKSTFWSDFRTFAMRGNVVDMAVGVVIGGAFSKIVSSLVDNIIMPLIGLLVGKINFSDLAVVIPAQAEGAEPITIGYGLFLQNIVDFLIVALCIFTAIRLMNKLRRKKEEEKPAEPEKAPEPPAPTKEELLLTEIRDLLKEGK